MTNTYLLTLVYSGKVSQSKQVTFRLRPESSVGVMHKEESGKVPYKWSSVSEDMEAKMYTGTGSFVIANHFFLGAKFYCLYKHNLRIFR